MKKYIFPFSLITLLFCLFAGTLFAQGGRRQGQGQPDPAVMRERIKQYKEEYIREALVLTDEDAKKFFPVYNQFDADRFALKQAENKLKRGFMAKSDEQLKADLEKMLQLKEQELELEKTYMKKFLAILTPRQVAALYHAENQFRRKLLERFGEAAND
jgi:hypothetical protein